MSEPLPERWGSTGDIKSEQVSALGCLRTLEVTWNRPGFARRAEGRASDQRLRRASLGPGDATRSRASAPWTHHGCPDRRVLLCRIRLSRGHDLIERLRRAGIYGTEHCLDDPRWMEWRDGQAHRYEAA